MAGSGTGGEIKSYFISDKSGFRFRYRDRIVEFIKGKIKSGDNRPISISVYRINTKLSYGILLSKLKELETKI